MPSRDAADTAFLRSEPSSSANPDALKQRPPTNNSTVGKRLVVTIFLLDCDLIRDEQNKVVQNLANIAAVICAAPQTCATFAFDEMLGVQC